MCNQTVCLVQAAIERAGIATVSISLLREITEIIRPPRALHVPFPMGYPLGKWGFGPRKPVHEVAARNSWEGDLGFTVPEPLWQK